MASAGTFTDQAPLASEVAVSSPEPTSSEPTVTVTVTPASEPVSPDIENPSAFSAMFTVSSPAMSLAVSAREPASSTVMEKVAVASLYRAVPAVAAVTTHSPTPSSVNSPLAASTTHTSEGVAEYDRVPRTVAQNSVLKREGAHYCWGGDGWGDIAEMYTVDGL